MKRTYCGVPLFDDLGIWDGDGRSFIIRHRNGHVYLLNGDPALPYYDNCIRLDRTRLLQGECGLLTIAPDSLDGFRKDCKTRYTLKPVCRYELEHIDLSRLEDIPEAEWDMDTELEYGWAVECMDYVVERNK